MHNNGTQFTVSNFIDKRDLLKVMKQIPIVNYMAQSNPVNTFM